MGFDEQEFEEAIHWITKKHGLKIPPVRVVNGPLKRFGNKSMLGIVEPSGQISVSNLAPIRALFHEANHLADLQKTGRWSNSANNPEINPETDQHEAEIDQRAAEDYLEFKEYLEYLENYRLENKVRPIVGKVLEISKGYEREMRIEELREAQRAESQPRPDIGAPKDARPFTVKRFLAGEFERRQNPELQKSAPAVTPEDLENLEKFNRAIAESRAELDANPKIVTKEIAANSFDAPGFRKDFEGKCSHCNKTVSGTLECQCQVGKGFSIQTYLAQKARENLE